MPAPALSIVICTCNPRPDLFRRVLDAIEAQTLPATQFELIVVDNNSLVPLDAAAINRGRFLSARVVREPRQGLVFARRRGILEARADLLVFVDDDNFLDPDYLEKTLRIARANPRLGAFGGISRGLLEPGWIPHWKKSLLHFLGIRDHGPLPITSCKDEWGKHEPIGTGLVLRKAVGLLYCHVVDAVPAAQRLDRCGNTMLSGSDSLAARCAYRLGLCCSYQPVLKLDHFIKTSRLTAPYLRALLLGHGRSVVLLQRALGKRVIPLSFLEVLSRFPYRLATKGIRP